MFTSVSAIKNKRVQHVGMYTDPAAIKRVLNDLEGFAGLGHKLHSIVEFKQKGVYNARPAKPPKTLPA